MTIIATHSGTFHADDAFACEIFRRIIESARFVRTRDPKVIAEATFAVDVGGIWDPSKGRFDHHQKGFDGRRDSGVLYASAGLVWREYGEAYVASIVPASVTEVQVKQIARAIDDSLIQYLDMADTGTENTAPGRFGIAAVIADFNPTWFEGDRVDAQGRSELRDQLFHSAMDFASGVLRNAIRQEAARFLAEDQVRASELIFEGKVLLLRNGGLPWSGIVCDEMSEVLFVVYPDSTDGQFQVQTVPVSPDSFQARKDLPESWAGLRNDELAVVCGVPDAVFCHNGRFIGGARTLDGALRMAEIALKG